MAGVLISAALWATSVAEPSSPAPRPIVAPAAFRAAGYGEYWSTSLAIGNDPVVSAHLLEENLYVRTQSGAVYAVQADTGLVRWVRSLGGRLFEDRAPTHLRLSSGDGPVVFVTYTALQLFDRYSGEALQQIDLPFSAAGGGCGGGRLGVCGGR